MGTGSAHLDNGDNDITTRDTSFRRDISYAVASALTVGTVSDTFSGMSTSGITSTNHDVKLTAGNDLAINQAVTLGTGNLTLVDTGNITQSARSEERRVGKQCKCAGSAHHDNGDNDIYK